uniref:Uncharacterized protein n=1 Tax=Arundo donax TaxID=35708 RepID=A0A0A8ZHH3_ARUDO
MLMATATPYLPSTKIRPQIHSQIHPTPSIHLAMPRSTPEFPPKALPSTPVRGYPAERDREMTDLPRI